MPARAAAGDVEGPRAETIEVLAVSAGLRDARARVRQRAQAEETRPALRRAFAGQVPHDPGGLAHRAPAMRKNADHAAAKAKALLPQRGRVEGDVPAALHVHPGAEIASNQDGARRGGRAAGSLDRSADRHARLDLDDAWAGDRAGHRDQ